MGNDYVKGGLLLAVGGALGAITTLSLSKKKIEIKPTLAELLAGGIGLGTGLKERALTVYEKTREDVEDIVAGADQLRKSKSESAVTEKDGSKAESP